jgi:hypothetical protein
MSSSNSKYIDNTAITTTTSSSNNKSNNNKNSNSNSNTKVSYIKAILDEMMKDQLEHNYIKFGSTYLKYRKVVSEWMVEVCDYFDLHPTTSHAAIAYLDRLQPNEKCSRLEWQMLAISCILLSSKYNESEEHVPDLATLEEITQQSISNEIILNYELWILKKLGWKLNGKY